VKVRHCITGYNRRTDELAYAVDLPEMLLPYVKAELVKVPEDDQDALWSYVLNPWQLSELSRFMTLEFEPETNEYFLESCSEEASEPHGHAQQKLKTYG